MPASPETSTTWPSPSFAFDQRRRRSSSSSSRPTSSVNSLPCIASKRLATELARSAAHALICPAMPLRSFCPNLEELAEKPASALGDDDRIRLGDALQARRKVWGFTHDPTFLGLPGGDEIADHHQPGRYANADLQRLLDAQL